MTTAKRTAHSTTQILGLALMAGVIVSNDVFAHDFTLDDFDIYIYLGPGSEAVVDLSSVPPGTYDYFCSLHSEGGDPMTGTMSRWLSAKREPPNAFWPFLYDLENDRLARADARVSGLWLALCEDDLTVPETVDLRLVQLWEWVVGEDLTPEQILALAGPLTPQAMAKIERALNTPIREFQAKV